MLASSASPSCIGRPWLRNFKINKKERKEERKEKDEGIDKCHLLPLASVRSVLHVYSGHWALGSVITSMLDWLASFPACTHSFL